jgi:hypothetical protein
MKKRNGFLCNLSSNGTVGFNYKTAVEYISNATKYFYGLPTKLVTFWEQSTSNPSYAHNRHTRGLGVFTGF